MLAGEPCLPIYPFPAFLPPYQMPPPVGAQEEVTSPPSHEEEEGGGEVGGPPAGAQPPPTLVQLYLPLAQVSSIDILPP
jgi:hypothetical protein